MYTTDEIFTADFPTVKTRKLLLSVQGRLYVRGLTHMRASKDKDRPNAILSLISHFIKIL